MDVNEMAFQYILFFYNGLYACELLLFHMSVANFYHFSFIFTGKQKESIHAV